MSISSMCPMPDRSTKHVMHVYLATPVLPRCPAAAAVRPGPAAVGRLLAQRRGHQLLHAAHHGGHDVLYYVAVQLRDNDTLYQVISSAYGLSCCVSWPMLVRMQLFGCAH